MTLLVAFFLAVIVTLCVWYLVVYPTTWQFIIDTLEYRKLDLVMTLVFPLFIILIIAIIVCVHDLTKRVYKGFFYTFFYTFAVGILTVIFCVSSILWVPSYYSYWNATWEGEVIEKYTYKTNPIILGNEVPDVSDEKKWTHYAIQLKYKGSIYLEKLPRHSGGVYSQKIEGSAWKTLSVGDYVVKNAYGYQIQVCRE